MPKIFFIIVLSVSSFGKLYAQHAGYTTMADLHGFKSAFATASQHIQTIKSDFVQEKNLSMLSEKIISRGKFWFKKTDLVRMEYSQPYSYLLVINKSNVYVKDGQKENKISTKSNKLFQQINKIILDCVQGTALSNPDFKILVFESAQSYLIELTPVGKGLKEYFKSINVVVSKKDYSVNKIEMLEPGGDNTVISFTNKELNPQISDALFTIN
jgi:outer membrane lipoprotein-sorting protein